MGLAAQSSAASALVSKAERDTMSRSRLRSDPPVVVSNPSPDYNYKKGLHKGDLNFLVRRSFFETNGIGCAELRRLGARQQS